MDTQHPQPRTNPMQKSATARPQARESRTGIRPTGTRCNSECRKPTAAQAHCTVCHTTFSGVSYFDAHRRDGWCLNPADLGLVDNAGLWATAEGHERRAADAARLAAHRSQDQP